MVRVNGKYNYGNENQCDTSERMTQKIDTLSLNIQIKPILTTRYIGR